MVDNFHQNSYCLWLQSLDKVLQTSTIKRDTNPYWTRDNTYTYLGRKWDLEMV